METQEPLPHDPTPEEAKGPQDAPAPTTDLLAPFAARNPEAKIQVVDDHYLIENPWGDDTVAIRIGVTNQNAIELLNEVRFPPRFSAVMHSGSGDMEFVFGPVREDDVLRSRRFCVCYRGQDYICEFADASDVLLSIRNASKPVGPSSETNYRNLGGLRVRIVKKKGDESEKLIQTRLTSFYIRGVRLPEADLPDLARHINFYMKYYDRETPYIVIHSEPISLPQLDVPIRFPMGNFPEKISMRPLDPYLLTLWEGGSLSRDPSKRILYNYQVIEYAAFYYLREEVLRGVRRLIADPCVFGKTEEISRQVVELLTQDKVGDEAKIVAVVQQTVDPEAVWRDIEQKKEFFAKEAKFDGGFSIPPLIKQTWEFEDFKAAWIPKLPDALRKLRNALVHAREQRLCNCVAPTVNNNHLLRPWSELATTIGNQVILYGETYYS